MVELASVPLERALGPEVGGLYRDLHAAQGVDLHFGVGVEGFELGNGVAVDEHRVASAPGVFAGDVADVFYPRYGRRIRLEHWSAALNQGPVAAKKVLGRPVAYDQLPYFFSDQYDPGMEFRGWAPSFDLVVFRGDPASDDIEALLRAEQPVDVRRLTDPDVELASLAKS